MNLSSIVLGISYSACLDNHSQWEAMKEGGDHHMLCFTEKSNMFSSNNDRERLQHFSNEAMGYGKAKALLEDLRAATHWARTYPEVSLWQNMWSLNYCCCYCLEDKEMSPTGTKPRGNKNMNKHTKKKIQFQRKNFKGHRVLHSKRKTFFPLKPVFIV